MMSPQEMAAKIGSGLLSFPVTHFDADLQFDAGAYRKHCSWLLEYDVAGLFAAGGTGEFFSLNAGEVTQVIAEAVAETAGRVPVISGCGYGTSIAVGIAQAAERAGADGVLLLPPYLMVPGQEGLAAHIEAVCHATKLGVIVYNRDNAVVEPDTLARLCERNPNLVGYKDGIGDVELMMRIYCKLGDRLTYIGGLPTAETFAPAYLEMGVTTYSSAIFNFMPEWAVHFYDAVCARDKAAIVRELNDFVLPYIALRNRCKGYAVSIVKAGCDLVDRPAGAVRPPLTGLKPDERAELGALIHRAHEKLAVAA